MTTHFKATCPTCGYQVDSHSAIGDEDAAPDDGDLCICLACGTPAAFASVMGRLVMRRLTDAEFEEAMADPKITNAMIAHREARAHNPDWPRGPLDAG